ncbi:MAG: cell division protein FtsZ, partial [Alphaproteobacteria bacterium]|nr:cell division protein FtsZ [Alphaproteobacteria bacterium]
ELQKYVDTLIIIPNQNLFRVANEKTTFADAFGMADNVLHSGVRGITDLMVMPGLINLDFADVRTVMMEMGKAMMGTGAGEGENRAIDAAEAAIANPLLDDISMKGAKGVLINITGGDDLTLFEVDEAANRIRGEVDPEANIIVGSTFDEALSGTMRVSVFATGIDADPALAREPSTYAEVSRSITRPKPVEAEPAAMPEPAKEAKRPSLFVFEDENEAAEANAEAPQPVVEPKPEARPEPRRESALATETRVVIDDTEEYGAPAQDEGLLAQEKVNRLRDKIQELARVQDPYIAPEPMEVETDEEELAQQEPAQPDPFADAAMRNGSRRDDKRGPSLVERLTGRGKSRLEENEEPLTLHQVHPEDEDKPVSEERQKPAEPRVRAETQVRSESQTESKPEPRVRRPMTADQIDIPAFLRRQAN